MLNFGLTDLRLVSPRDGWPNPDAGPSASGADNVLAQARVFPTVSEATADLSTIYATTLRGRELTKAVVTPEQAGMAMRAARDPAGILFGPERSGLATDDLVDAQFILTIPVNPDFGSLNLAQAVLICAYEWRCGAGSAPASISNYAGPASAADLHGLIEALESALLPTGYFHPPERAAMKRRTVRNLISRPAFSEREVRTLRGIVTAFKKQP